MNLSKTQVKAVYQENSENSFDEICLGYTTLAMAEEEAARCLHCPHAPCKEACPAHNHIPDFIEQIKNGNIEEAHQILRITTFLPAICGRVCPHEKQCESVCVRGRNGEPVAIRNLERFASEGKWEISLPQEERKERVAIIGAGPAGLMCAYKLRSQGFIVDVYDENKEVGGALVYAIPSFRLPHAVVDKEVARLTSMGVHFILGKRITLDAKTFMDENHYDALFLATGAAKDKKMNIPGEELENIFEGNEILKKIKRIQFGELDEDMPLKDAKRILVVGGGNVAMDAASTFLRMGKEVFIMYRRSEEEMPANKDDIALTKKEGAQFLFLKNPKAFLGDHKVEQVSYVEMQLSEEKDASGRRKFMEVPGSLSTFDIDGVITCISASPDTSYLSSSIEKTSWGSIVIQEETGKTNIENVYAGGDVVTGPLTVVKAMKAGELAALSIIEKLKSE